MSTKDSIAYGDNFHFYGEALEDDEARYLELEGAEFQANHRGVTVKIPAAIWEVIRHLGGPDISLVDLTDDEIRGRAESQTDRCIASYSEAAGSDRAEAYLRVCGWDRPREEQATTIAATLKDMQAHQRRLAAEIQAIRSAMRRDKAGQGEAS